ncbi:endolytic transglycosylase MltG [Desulfofundulus sp.]|uniref:endolytic transglycosylase MltG n=1 Tax=Desulfofundulus sp. TaxID=2282750 RepID=UPI003C740A6B
MKLKEKKLLLAGGTAVLGLFLLISILRMFFPVASGHARTIYITIPRSASSSSIGRLLYEQGLVHSAWFFNFFTRLKGVDGKLKAGSYVFSTDQSLPEIVNELVKGPEGGYIFTVPEGFTLKQIAELLDREGLVTRQDFLTSSAGDNFDYPFLQGLPKGPNRLEGYLFPDTYRVGGNASAHEIIDLMLSRFNQKLKEMDYYRKVEKSGLTLHQAVTIASMVEREARVDRERPLIAGVILNRLKRGMPLQVDATVQYALGSQRAKLYYKDLEVDSPYNTYLNRGLPPGPIACPGEASLLAAVQPVRTNYLYYVARPDGTHAFASTLAEHNANKRKYLR